MRACGLHCGPKRRRPDFTGQLASVSYAPFVASQHPDYGDRPTVEQIRADLKAIAPYTRAIRTYSSTGGAELVPRDRRRIRPEGHGRRLDRQEPRPQRAGNPLRDRTRTRYSNVNAIVVGNETIYRGEMTVADLIQLIQRVKRSSPRPGHHGRNLDSLARASRACLGGRLSSPRTSCPTGRDSTSTQAVDQAISDLRQAAPGLSRQAHRDRRVRLAERRL